MNGIKRCGMMKYACRMMHILNPDYIDPALICDLKYRRRKEVFE